MKVEKCRVHIDFTDSDTFRLTSLYRQKTFTADKTKFIDLRTFNEVDAAKVSGDFFLRFLKDNSKYEFYALTGDNNYDNVDHTYHGQPLTVQVSLVLE